MKLSVCMIAHNEEAKIGAALESVRFADEVIVVDCESTDHTTEIVRTMGATVYARPNLDNLNINKNYSFDQAKGDFILCLDADEIVTEKSAAEIREIIASDPPQNGFFLPRCNHYFGHWLKHGGNYPDWQLRLFRRGKGRYAERHVHERITVEPETGRLRVPLLHYPYNSWEEARRKLDFYTSFEADYLYHRGYRPSLMNATKFLVWLPSVRLLRRYILKLGFLDGAAGWEAIQMDMRNFRMRYRKLCQIAQQLNQD